MLQSTLTLSPTSITADTTTNAKGATFEFDLTPVSSPMVVTVPGLGISNLQLSDTGGGPTSETHSGSAGGKTFDMDADYLDYVAYGAWSYGPTGGAPTNEGIYVLGYQTAVSAIPTSGTANYSGQTTGVTANPSGSSIVTGTLAGAASLSVNFATGVVSGSLTGMTATTSSGASQAWNDVSLSGSISGNTFSGTTAASSAPGGTLSLKASATGALKGGFYGPAADDVGAVWTLSDGRGAAVGAFGAAKQAPSDRRIKRDIRPEGRRRDGLRLYSFRYLADNRRFVGVLAQDLLGDARFAPAVVTGPGGLMLVDYGQLGLDVTDLPQMREAGFAAMSLYEKAQSAARP